MTFRERLGAGCDITAGSRQLPRTFDELFEQKRPTLTLEETQTGKFTCIDETGRVYFYPSTYDMAAVIRFMRALAFRGDVTLDEGSITWFRALRAGEQHSLKVSSVEGEPSGGQSPWTAPVSPAAVREPASPSRQIGVAAALPQGAAAAGDKAAAPMHLRLVN